ncbi:MAG: PadR family transcriptional regulator [Christensenellales bacterium]
MSDTREPGCRAGGKPADRFLEACLLQLLSEGTGHGYALMEQLAAFGVSSEGLNVSTLYRRLRHMEKEGLLQSDWEEGGRGPKRRVYLIAEKGKEELEIRIRMMKARKSGIDRLISAYDQAQERAVQAGGTEQREETS